MRPRLVVGRAKRFEEEWDMGALYVVCGGTKVI